jgi:hypothetical protein
LKKTKTIAGFASGLQKVEIVWDLYYKLCFLSCADFELFEVWVFVLIAK